MRIPTTVLRWMACGTLLLLHASTVLSNNITVSNTSLGPQNIGNQTISINFNVAWENSWRTSTNESNYDGAWLFVKFRKNGTSDWRHCTLDAVTTPGTGATLTVPPDNKGAFIHRSANGIGNVSFTNNQLTWHYGDDGVLDGDNVEIKVFALEMVYIPEGSYYLGSGGSETNCFRKGNSTEPYLVTVTANTNGIPTGTAIDQLNFNGVGTNGNPIPASYPNGYKAFWLMKYECSQQQFADFLNHLNSAQATTHNTSTNFAGSSHPNFTPLVADRAYDNLGAAQLLAFADWAGLRPYSELEFEKACRGRNIAPVPNEYPWGTTSATQLLTNQISNADQPNEGVNVGSMANAAYGNGVNRPVRVGIFARTTGSGRELSGATYYGVLNMADNLHELTIQSGTALGQSFDALTHGDGDINTIATWQAAALGARGARRDGPETDMRVSHRQWANVNVQSAHWGYGIRLARTAP